MLRMALVVVVLSFCCSCSEVGEHLFRPKYDYSVVFYSQNNYDLENVGFRAGDSFWSCGWLCSNQMATARFLTVPLKEDIWCEWKKEGKLYRKKLHLPQSAEKKFWGTIVFFFANDDVTMEYEMYADRINGGLVEKKYDQMYNNQTH